MRRAMQRFTRRRRWTRTSADTTPLHLVRVPLGAQARLCRNSLSHPALILLQHNSRDRQELTIHTAVQSRRGRIENANTVMGTRAVSPTSRPRKPSDDKSKAPWWCIRGSNPTLHVHKLHPIQRRSTLRCQCPAREGHLTCRPSADAPYVPALAVRFPCRVDAARSQRTARC